MRIVPALVLLAAAAAHRAVGAPPEAGNWVWCAALVIAGMPHGAYDLAVVRRTSPARGTLIARSVRYTAIMGGAALLLWLLPVPAIGGFLLLTAYHFGTSDSVWTRGVVRPRFGDALAGVGRGMVIIAAPFWFQPEASWAPFAGIASLVQDGGPVGFAWLGAVGGGFVATGVLLVLMRAVRTGTSVGDQVEEWSTLAAVMVVSAAVPPLLAIGVYFLAVHAAGHCFRATVPGGVLPARAWRNAVRVHVESVPLLVPSIAMVLAGAWLMGGVGAGTVARAFLIFCIVATLAHQLVWRRAL